jgi:hypothetical protein
MPEPSISPAPDRAVPDQNPNLPYSLVAEPGGPSIESFPVREGVQPVPERMFVIPTIEGGQAVIRDPAKVAVSGSRRRELPERSSQQRSAGRFTKNLIVYGLCAVVLLAVLWWLLAHGPI